MLYLPWGKIIPSQGRPFADRSRFKIPVLLIFVICCTHKDSSLVNPFVKYWLYKVNQRILFGQVVLIWRTEVPLRHYNA